MKKFSVLLERSDISLRIEESAYIIAESTDNLNEEVKIGIKDIMQDGRGGKIKTLIDLSWSTLLYSLSGYIKKDLNDGVCISGRDYDEGSYSVTFEVNDDFNAINVDVIFHLMYDFMVNRTLGRYFSIAKKDEAGMHMQDSDRNLIEIKRCLAAPTRKKAPTVFF